MAVTQKGAKIRSVWAADFRRRSINFMGDATRKQIYYVDNDQTMKIVMEDWMFEGAPLPPSEIRTLALMGVGQ